MSLCLEKDTFPLNTTSEDTAQSYTHVTSVIMKTCSGILISFGTVGNLVNLCVLFRHSFSKKITSTAISLRFLAYCDLLVLWTLVGRFFVLGVYGYEVRNTSMSVCRLHKCWHFLSTTVVNCTLALVAVTRYIRIAHPFRVHILINQVRIYLSIVVILILAMATSSISYVYHTGPGKNSSASCDVCSLAPGINVVFFKIVQVVPAYILPGVCIFFFHWRILVTYNWMVTKKQKLKQQYLNHVQRIESLRKGVRLEQVIENVRTCPSEESLTSSKLSPKDSPKTTEVDRPIQSALKKKRKSPKDLVKKRPRFSHVLDLETAKIEMLTFSASTSRQASFSDAVDPDLPGYSDETKVWIMREERNLRRIRAAYGVLLLAAHTDDYLGFDTCISSLETPSELAPIFDFRDYIAMKSPNVCHRVKLIALNHLVYCASICYFVCNLPFCIWYVIAGHVSEASRLDQAQKNLATTIVLMLTFLTNALNFLLYSCLTSKFQLEFHKCIDCLRQRRSLDDDDDISSSTAT